MAQRITMVLNDNLASKLRRLQSDLIKENQKSISFSFVLNQTLEKGLKKN